MKKKIIIIISAIFTILILVTLAGVLYFRDREIDDREDQLEEMVDDEFYDGRSICWDGETFTVGWDSLDTSMVSDGRFGEYYHREVDTELGIIIDIPETNETKILLEQEPKKDDNTYILETEDRFFSVRRMDSKATQSYISERLESKQIIKSDDGREAEYYEGFIESGNNGLMIGNIFVIQDENSENVFVIEYAGYGNYSDIMVEAVERFDFTEN